MPRTVFYTLILFILPFAALAQNATIYGTVTGEGIGKLPGGTVKATAIKLAAIADSNGYFNLQIPSNQKITIEFSYTGFATQHATVDLKDGERKKLNIKLLVKVDTIPLTVITKQNQTPGLIKIDPKTFEYFPSADEGIEAYIKMFAGSNNELASEYSVRGGNFDENLVYVNDFEIFKPQLTTSGQQEGLSFINPDMVNSVLFSTGGFQAKYGDKLSSVLDVDYKKPKKFAGSVSASLLGGSIHLEGCSNDYRFTYIIGARYKSDQYLLGSLPTTGDYKPTFGDLQAYFTYQLSNITTLEYIVNGSYNKFLFIPQSEVTTFGDVSEVLRLDIAFEGQELDTYNSIMNGFAINFKPSKNLNLKFLTSAYFAEEDETNDIIGDYFIGEVQTDLSQSNFGQTLYALGEGETHDWSRDYLNEAIVNVSHKGSYYVRHHFFQWGATVQHEYISDQLNEWEILDSAGYELPYNPSVITTNSYVQAQNTLNSMRYNGFAQDMWELSDSNNLMFSYGLRSTYWDLNKQFLVSPRFQLLYKPLHWKNDYDFHISLGEYDQPPFYRELRDTLGVVHTNVKAQRSEQLVLGTDYNFKMWNRPFKFTTEAYYKNLWDVNPYIVDDVRIRYYANNSAVGFAEGIDFRLNGQLVKDLDSWVSLSILNTKEKIPGYFFYDTTQVKNSAGTVTKVDSSKITPGYIPRPTDQVVTFNMFFQDYVPGNKNFKVHLNLVFATGLPTGPPGSLRFRDAIRLPPYRRVDIGFSALLVDGKKEKNKGKVWGNFKTIWVSLEVLNLLGIQNTVSYLWIKDYTNTTYAVPNYLTNRILNLKLQVNF